MNEYPLCPKGHVTLKDKKTNQLVEKLGETWFICSICKWRTKA